MRRILFVIAIILFSGCAKQSQPVSAPVMRKKAEPNLQNIKWGKTIHPDSPWQGKEILE